MLSSIVKLIIIISCIFNPAFSQVLEEGDSDSKFEKNDTKFNSLYSTDFYLLGPGDILNIIFYDVKELSGTYKVMSDGRVSLPLVGNIMVENLSIEQAIEKFQKLYSEQLLRPELHISIKEARPIKVSIVGEVEKPGLYSLTNKELVSNIDNNQISNNGLPSLINAIQKAGGITQNANLRKVVLKRRLPTEERKYKMTEINLLELLFEGDQSKNPYLFDGDIIIIKTAEELSPDILKIAKGNFSPKFINVYVVGAVVKPGKLEVTANQPLVQTIMQAGGPIDWVSNKGNIELIRINNNGTAALRKFRLNLNQNLSEKKNPPLKEGDVIKVNSSSIAKLGTGIDTVTKPLNGIVNSLAIFKLLND